MAFADNAAEYIDNVLNEGTRAQTSWQAKLDEMIVDGKQMTMSPADVKQASLGRVAKFNANASNNYEIKPQEPVSPEQAPAKVAQDMARDNNVRRIHEEPNMATQASEVGVSLKSTTSLFGAICCEIENAEADLTVNAPQIKPTNIPETPDNDVVSQHMDRNEVKPDTQLQPEEVKYTHLANNSLSSGPMPM